MSYLDEVQRQSKKVFVFARMSIKKRYSYADRVAYDGTRDAITLDADQTDVQSFALTGTQANDNNERNEFTFVGSIAAVNASGLAYFDSANNRIIFYNFIPGVASLFTATVESSLYFSTYDLGWYQDPTDDSTTMRKWTGSISSVPSVKQGAADNFSGFAPIEISPLEIQWQNADMYRYFRETSFVNCMADIWLCYGDLEPENITKIFSGKIRGLSFDDKTVEFNLTDYSYLLDANYNGIYADSLGSGQFDPNDVGRAIPLVAGHVRWLKCTNQDYQNDSPTTSDNRIWTVHDSSQGSHRQLITLLTVGSPFGGQYPVTVSAAERAKIYENQSARRVSDGAMATVRDNGVTVSVQVIAGTPSPGDQYYLDPILQYRFQIPSSLVATLDVPPTSSNGFADSSDDGQTVSITLATGFEAWATALGITTIDPNDFELWVEVLGTSKDVSIDGTYINNDEHPSDVGILAWYLKQIVGLSDDQLDGPSFVAAKAARPYVAIGQQNRGGITSPFESTEFESHRDVVSALLKQIGAVGYFNGEGKFTIKARGVLGAADWTLTESEIEPGSMRYDYYDSDMKAFNVDGNSPYVGTEFEYRVTKTPLVYAWRTRFSSFVADPIGSPYGYSLKELPVETEFSYDLCRIENAYSVPTYLPAVKRMATYFGNRQGQLRLKAFGSIVDALPGETVEIERELLPGYEYVQGTNRTRTFFILEVERKGDSIELLVEDQYSIEEAGGF